MIEIKDKTKCSGCSACKQICPKKCIEMKPDNEGFLYPEVDKQNCINCDLCTKICPILNKKQNIDEVNDAYAVYNTDENIRKNSTSGGFFTAIGETIIEKGGVVFGAAFNDDFKIVHTYVDKKEELYKFRGSKYVQSEILDNYKKAENFLKQDRYVLFSGTPCQIYGLKAYLKEDYEKLYCVDLICKGVPSPKLWKKYIEYKKTNGNIEQINFREKTYGFSSTTMSIYYKNKRKEHNGHESDFFLNVYVKELSSRPSCYDCKFKTKDRISDFTIGDFWHVEKVIKEIDDDKGVTLLIAHTIKAKEILNELLRKIKIIKVDLEKALVLNGGQKVTMLTSSAIQNKLRNNFFGDLEKMNLKTLEKTYNKMGVKNKIKRTLKPILYKLGILENIKKITKK